MEYGKEYRRPGNVCGMPTASGVCSRTHRASSEASCQNRRQEDTCCENSGECISGNPASRLKGYPLAMVYSPNQDWCDLYEPDMALKQGTLFSALYFPWEPMKCRDKCCNDRKCR